MSALSVLGNILYVCILYNEKEMNKMNEIQFLTHHLYLNYSVTKGLMMTSYFNMWKFL